MQGRYIDAAQVFEHTEAELGRYDDEERARYGFYRGATLLALGDPEDGRHWLEYGSAAGSPLSPAERSALIEGVPPATREKLREALRPAPPELTRSSAVSAPLWQPAAAALP